MKEFIITNDLKVIVGGWQIDTVVFIENSDQKKYVYLDVDKWTELKKSILAIDTEFWKRFNYQYPNL